MGLELEDPTVIEIHVSARSLALLEELASYGIYGITVEEVARRFIDRGLGEFCDPPFVVGKKTQLGVRRDR